MQYMKDKIKELLRTKKKYFILVGIYILCIVMTSVYDPWADHPDYTDDDTGPDYFIFYDYRNGTAYDYFYEGTYLFYIPDEFKDSSWTKPFIKITSFGAEDIYSFYNMMPKTNFRQILTVIFPLMMMLKMLISKKLFKKEKDKVELNETRSHRRFRLLYYRSESIIAEIIMDNIAFFCIGAVSLLISWSFSPLARNCACTGWEMLSDHIYSVLLIFTLPIYKASEFLSESLFYDINLNMSYCKISQTTMFLIVKPLINLGLIIAFELTIRLIMRLYEAAVNLIKLICKKLAKDIEGLIKEPNTV